jgi:hypothetical protein
MRVHRSASSARQKEPLNIYSPTSIFNRDVTSLAISESQEAAKKLANQFNYNNQSYTHWFGYTGPGYAGSGAGAGVTRAGIQPPKEFSPTLWVVPPGQPTQKVTLNNTQFFSEAQVKKLQEAFNAVPVPTMSLIPSGSLWTPIGGDKWVIIWQPSTGKYWEMWKMEGIPGEYVFQAGGYVANANAWNGIFANPLEEREGGRGSGLAMLGGAITLQDLIEVLKGGSIKHAIIIDIPVTKTESGAKVPPATKRDLQTFIPELIPAGQPKEGEANPPYPALDGLAEGNWCRFPAASRPSEYGITGTLQKAIYEAIRKYGVFVGDADGSLPFTSMESPQALGSPYSYANLNPFNGASAGWSPSSYTWIPKSLDEPLLPSLEEEPKGLYNSMPFQTLEALAPRSS